MDQDSFRSLLTVPAASSANVSKSKAYNRGSLLASGSSSAKKTEPSEAAFKPRKIKKPTDSKYRDRASERRGGVNEYAEVEGILEDFEKRTAGEDKEIVEEQRKYLGGDATHTVLVKGLDFALLEQTRAREEAREDLDEDLESAFLGTTLETDPEPTTTLPAPSANPGKKRTRAELLAELQKSRGTDSNSTTEQGAAKPPTRQDELEALERAKQAGKFKPMGASSFAPVEKKKKKKKKVPVGDGKVQEPTTKDEKGKGKAKASIHGGDGGVPPQVSEKSEQAGNLVEAPSITQPTPTDVQPPELASPSLAAPAIPAPPPAPVEDVEDIDPFAEAGDYEPDYGDDSDDEGAKKPKETSQLPPSSTLPAKRNWFNETEPEPAPVLVKIPTPPPQSPKETEETELPKATRLAGLSSSAMPSVAEYLAMDKEEEAREKKRARKEKKKKGGG